MPLPNPNCPRCHSSGEIETMTKDATGFLVSIEYSKCPCTFRSQWVDQEDWTDDRNPNLPSP